MNGKKARVMGFVLSVCIALLGAVAVLVGWRYARNYVMGLLLLCAAATAFTVSVFWKRFFTLPEVPAAGGQGISWTKSALIVMALVILFSVLPMGLSPAWNGQESRHRNQYELMADALLDGRLYIEYDDEDPRLAEMENPYDPQARQEAGVSFHWDHAYYNGHYYMYFGIVPALLLFAPFKLLTGVTLVTYHATQIFTALYILGLFVLLKKLASRFFRQLPQRHWLFMASAFSLASVWFIITAPALYCTAIAAGICMEVWSFVFFFQAVYLEPEENRQIGNAFLGALFGALAFGCRPTIALANLVVIPLLVYYLKNKGKITLKLVGKLVIAAMPYVVIGALLMAYNYARFENPFEFGQSYQLTVADQQGYGDMLSNSGAGGFSQLGSYFAGVFGSKYPGIIWEYPVLLCIGLILEKKSGKFLRENGLYSTAWVMAAAVGIIVLAQILASPFLIERYKMDILWLMAILCFITASGMYCTREEKGRKNMGVALDILCLYALFVSVMLFLVPNDKNFTAYYAARFLPFL